MNGIIGMSELALQSKLTPEQREYLLHIVLQSAKESLLRLLNDILDFLEGRGEASSSSSRSPFHLRDHLSDAIHTLYSVSALGEGARTRLPHPRRRPRLSRRRSRPA